MRIHSLSIVASSLVFAVHSVAGTEAVGWQPPAGHTQVPIWPVTPPDARPITGPETFATNTTDLVAGRSWVHVDNVSQPTITRFAPQGKNTGAAVVVFPGGGYWLLAIDLEGTEVCDWLAARGVTAVLLKYRVPGEGKLPKSGAYPKSAEALQDAQRAIGLVRFHAAEWHIDPHKIGVLGFSAGGHLVAAVSTHFEKRLYPAVDDADKESCRPDFAVALYPGHMLENTSKEFELNPYLPVSSKTPPTFLVQAKDDRVDPVENSLMYFEALKRASVPVEMHLYADGGHAFGLRRTDAPITHWPELAETWLKTIGMISKHQTPNPRRAIQ
jgi:acetyl esterase/lipase